MRAKTKSQSQTKPEATPEQRYIELAGDFILDHLPESDDRAERVLAYVKQHIQERHSTFPRSGGVHDAG